jgi:hypothetical protein
MSQIKGMKTMSHFASTVERDKWIEQCKQNLRQGGTIHNWVLDDKAFAPHSVIYGWVTGDSY